MNLIPFPRVSTHLSNPLKLSFTYLCQQLHFLMPSYAPFYDPRAVKYEKNSVPELTKAYVATFPSSQRYISTTLCSLFDRKNLLVACDPRFG